MRILGRGSVTATFPSDATTTTTTTADDKLIPLGRVRTPRVSPDCDSIEVEANGEMKRERSKLDPSINGMKKERSRLPPSSVHNDAIERKLKNVEMKKTISKPPRYTNNDSIEVEANGEMRRAVSRLTTRSVKSRGNESAKRSRTSERKRVTTQPRQEGMNVQQEGQEMPLGMCPYEEEDLKNFDLMNISITIYSITGILCEERETKKKSKSSNSRKSSKSRESTPVARTYSDEEEMEVNPTTVATSVKRNAISSQTVIETFYPSKPLKIECTPGVATNLSAVWQSPSAELLGGVETRQDNEEDRVKPEPSFELLRMMMKKPFTKGQVHVDNYVHEHVQIGINLCRGGELMRLGVATLIITGEEEGQVAMHVPVRLIANPGIQSVNTKPTRSKKKKNKQKTCFNNDNKMFRLNENASLYVGVQVNPRRDVEAAAQFDDIDDIETSDSQLLRAAHLAKAQLLELRAMREKKEQASIGARTEVHGTNNPERIKGGASSATSSSQAQKSNSGADVLSSNPEYNMLSGIFCGAIPMMPGSNAPTQSQNVAQASQASKTKEENVHDLVDDSSVLVPVRQPSIPMSEIVNVKYSPAYAASFFSNVTYSYTHCTELTDTEQEHSETVQKTERPTSGSGKQLQTTLNSASKCSL